MNFNETHWNAEWEASTSPPNPNFKRGQKVWLQRRMYGVSVPNGVKVYYNPVKVVWRLCNYYRVKHANGKRRWCHVAHLRSVENGQ